MQFQDQPADLSQALPPPPAAEVHDYRLIVSIDIYAESLDAAYRKMRDTIHADLVDLGYETSDEYYIDGELGAPDDLQAAIERVFDAEDAEEEDGVTQPWIDYRPVVVVTRHPDEADDIAVFAGTGEPEVVYLDLGSGFDITRPYEMEGNED